MRQDMAKTRDPSNDLVAKNLKAFRAESGLTTEQAAQMSGVSVDNLRRYERGDSGVPADALRALAAIYGHAMDDFYVEKPPKADLAGRPQFRLQTMPGMNISAKHHKELQDHIDKANAEIRSRKK
jgi:transcriptional regulator with XRE-family HTH domain